MGKTHPKCRSDECSHTLCKTRLLTLSHKAFVHAITKPYLTISIYSEEKGRAHVGPAVPAVEHYFKTLGRFYRQNVQISYPVPKCSTGFGIIPIEPDPSEDTSALTVSITISGTKRTGSAHLGQTPRTIIFRSRHEPRHLNKSKFGDPAPSIPLWRQDPVISCSSTKSRVNAHKDKSKDEVKIGNPFPSMWDSPACRFGLCIVCTGWRNIVDCMMDQGIVCCVVE